MVSIAMYREGRKQEWSDRGIDLEKFYDEAAVYGMIKMILSSEADKPSIQVIDKAKEAVLRSL